MKEAFFFGVVDDRSLLMPQWMLSYYSHMESNFYFYGVIDNNNKEIEDLKLKEERVEVFGAVAWKMWDVSAI